MSPEADEFWGRAVPSAQLGEKMRYLPVLQGLARNPGAICSWPVRHIARLVVRMAFQLPGQPSALGDGGQVRPERFALPPIALLALFRSPKVILIHHRAHVLRGRGRKWILLE